MVDCAHRVRAQAIEGISQEQLQTVRDVLEQMRKNLAGEAAVDHLRVSAEVTS
jgi:hypothetical protein